MHAVQCIKQQLRSIRQVVVESNLDWQSDYILDAISSIHSNLSNIYQSFDHNHGNQRPINRKPPICRFWRAGCCKFSMETCRFRHLTQNTNPLHCPFGQFCKFSKNTNGTHCHCAQRLRACFGKRKPQNIVQASKSGSFKPSLHNTKKQTIRPQFESLKQPNIDRNFATPKLKFKSIIATPNQFVQRSLSQNGLIRPSLHNRRTLPKWVQTPKSQQMEKRIKNANIGNHILKSKHRKQCTIIKSKQLSFSMRANYDKDCEMNAPSKHVFSKSILKMKKKFLNYKRIIDDMDDHKMKFNWNQYRQISGRKTKLKLKMREYEKIHNVILLNRNELD